MTLGRRHFLKFAASAIAGSQIDGLSTFHTPPILFVDKKLGFGFKIPHGWHLETFRNDFNKLLGGQKLAEPHSDDKEHLKDLGQGLMATLSKYPLEKNHTQKFSPSITFFKDPDDCLNECQDLLDLSALAISGYSEVLTNYECSSPPEYLNRKDYLIVRSKSKFLFEHDDVEPSLIDNETFIIHHQKSIYTIHLYDSPYIGDTSQSEFELFKESLHIA